MRKPFETPWFGTSCGAAVGCGVRIWRYDVTTARSPSSSIAGGLAHFAGLPRIELDGDRAVVTSYLQILTPHPTAALHEVPNHGVSKGFRIHRVAANRWELERTAAGWKIRRRTVRT